MAKIEDAIDRTWHRNFIDYTEMIVNHSNYEGLYYERGRDGRVKWVIAGKSPKGLLRRRWWDEQCDKHGIKIEAGCYAKIAVTIHPTKKHVCQICGKALFIEYVYPNKNTLKLLNENLLDTIEPYSLTIYEIVDKFGSSTHNIEAIKKAFRIKNIVLDNKSKII